MAWPDQLLGCSLWHLAEEEKAAGTQEDKQEKSLTFIKMQQILAMFAMNLCTNKDEEKLDVYQH